MPVKQRLAKGRSAGDRHSMVRAEPAFPTPALSGAREPVPASERAPGGARPSQAGRGPARGRRGSVSPLHLVEALRQMAQVRGSWRTAERQEREQCRPASPRLPDTCPRPSAPAHLQRGSVGTAWAGALPMPAVGPRRASLGTYPGPSSRRPQGRLLAQARTQRSLQAGGAQAGGGMRTTHGGPGARPVLAPGTQIWQR